MIYGLRRMLNRNLEGWHSFLLRQPTRCNQRSSYQIPTEDRYQGFGWRVPELFFGSGVHRYDPITVESH
jgi:hypothetical protein